MPSLVNQAGTGVVQDPELLANPPKGAVVTGVAADGAARLVVQIYANSPGDQLTLELAAGDDVGNDNDLPQNGIGMLQTILPADGTQSGSQVTVTAVSTSRPPMAFVLYVPPLDFSRGKPDDSAPSRTVTITARSSATGLNCPQTITIWRPPIIAVHGMWAGPSTWKTFQEQIMQNPISGPSQIYLQAVSYNQSLNGHISSSDPQYTGIASLFLGSATFSALGLQPNAATVDVNARQDIDGYKGARNAAVVQGDFVAHSLGGVVTRTLENQPGVAIDWRTFHSGIVHKLITIASPHLGSPLATQLLNPSTPCVRNKLAYFGNFVFQTATVDGLPLPGAVGDAEGAGTGLGALSEALADIQGSDNGLEIPTAMLAGQMTNNAQGLDPAVFDGAWWIRSVLCRSDPLAQSFTSAAYPMMMGGDSDGIIPTVSQQNGTPGLPVVLGVIHADALEPLGFKGPGELQVDRSPSNSFLTDVIQLLNAPSSFTCSQGSCVSPFYNLP